VTQISLVAFDRKLKRCAWTDADLARAAGLDRSTIVAIRRSGGELRTDTLEKITRAFIAKEEDDDRFVRTVDELMGAGAE
jgi:transcriptional regulator with XRE-family HTH domain